MADGDLPQGQGVHPGAGLTGKVARRGFVERSGFRPEDERSQQGANYGWQRYIGGLGAGRRATEPTD